LAKNLTLDMLAIRANELNVRLGKNADMRHFLASVGS
jgi:hypothetical protein